MSSRLWRAGRGHDRAKGRRPAGARPVLTDPFFYAMAIPAVILMGLAKSYFNIKGKSNASIQVQNILMEK